MSARTTIVVVDINGPRVALLVYYHSVENLRIEVVHTHGEVVRRKGRERLR